ncbi:ATP-binding protein [Legionella sp. 31fI33]|uniref:ATP-binding protein n=1 Tax=Legionella sp. 31fI33 TaxID=2886376 RepID=UPI001E4EBE01|nr:ATP-binding protein [Legionella sp. 31fI33]MCC5015584.1 ATP-binding protein [Legionella sp. 31fI33]
MTTIKIAPTNNPFVVKLSLDLKSYCEAYIKHAAEPANQELFTQFKKLRTLIGETLTGVGGALHWPAIKALWAKPAQERGFDFLNANYQEPAPLVIDTLDRFFIELLKNSVDAILKNYVDSQQSTTQLEMSIELDLNDKDTVSVVIKDNSGGFPNNYIQNFPAYIANHDYKKRSLSSAAHANTFTSSKDKIAHYYFGGAGKGLAIILNLLLTGHLLEGPNQSKALYDVAENATAVSIENCTRGDKVVGAQLKFTSPVIPFSPPLAPLSNEKAAQDVLPLLLPTLNRRKMSEASISPVAESRRGLTAANELMAQDPVASISLKKLTISDSLGITFLAPPVTRKKLTIELPDDRTVASQVETAQIIPVI